MLSKILKICFILILSLTCHADELGDYDDNDSHMPYPTYYKLSPENISEYGVTVDISNADLDFNNVEIKCPLQITDTPAAILDKDKRSVFEVELGINRSENLGPPELRVLVDYLVFKDTVNIEFDTSTRNLSHMYIEIYYGTDRDRCIVYLLEFNKWCKWRKEKTQNTNKNSK
jgi:hypothetical protein